MNLGAAERQLNAMLDRAAAKTGEARPGQRAANELEEFWRASEIRVEKKRREENKNAWIDYFEHLAHSCRKRAEEYDAKAEALLEDQPKGETA